MSYRRYAVFDLLVDSVDGTYKARVLRSPEGGGEISFELPFARGEAEEFFARLGFRHRGAPSLQRVAAQELGGRLFGAVFCGEILGAFRSSLATCRRRNHGLRIFLRLGSVPELAVLPWEYLFDRARGSFLGGFGETTIVRCPAAGDAPRPLQVKPPLRVLVVTAGPQDLPRIEIEKEYGYLRDIFETSIPHIDHLRMDRTTLESLRLQLKNDIYHVFHFIGHGEFDNGSGQGGLILENENQRAHTIDSSRLAALLHRKFSLVVLNACHGARMTASNPFGGVANSLLQQGVPAVVAMQSFVSDVTAVTFAREFYADLATHGRVDRAMMETRKAIYLQSEVEWGIPVLYMRSDDDRIFQAPKLKPLQDKKPPMKEGRILTSYTGPISDLEEIKCLVALTAVDRRGYTVTISSPAGEVSERTSFPLEGNNPLSELLGRLMGRTQESQSFAIVQAAMLQNAQRIGELLCEALVPSSIREEFDSICQRARDSEVRLSLFLEIGWEARRLMSLPWEFLYRGAFLSLERTMSFVRCLPGDRPTSGRCGGKPLRILLVGPRRALLHDSDEKLWWSNDRRAKELGIETEILVGADKDVLRHALWKGGFDVLHFNSRAVVKEFSWKGVLLLESQAEGIQPVDAGYLASQIGEECSKRLQMVSFEPRDLVESEVNPCLDLAGTLVGRGAPCALALHFPLSLRAASAFWGTVYRLMAEGMEVSRAVFEGRMAIRAKCPGSNEWGGPALFEIRNE